MCNRRLAAALVITGLLLVSGCQGKGGGQVHRVEMKTMGFAPTGLTVAVGDTVVWANHDIVPHTATADSRQFDSGNVTPGSEWSLVVRQTGRIPYTCTFHPTMKGVLLVK